MVCGNLSGIITNEMPYDEIHTAAPPAKFYGRTTKNNLIACLLFLWCKSRPERERGRGPGNGLVYRSLKFGAFPSIIILTPGSVLPFHSWLPYS